MPSKKKPAMKGQKKSPKNSGTAPLKIKAQARAPSHASSELSFSTYLMHALKLAFFNTSGVKAISESKRALAFGAMLSAIGTLLAVLLDKATYPEGFTTSGFIWTLLSVFLMLSVLALLVNGVARNFGAASSYLGMLRLMFATEVMTILTFWYPLTGSLANWVIGATIIWWIAVLVKIAEAQYGLSRKQAIATIALVVAIGLILFVMVVIVVAVLGTMGLLGPSFQQYLLS